MSVLGYGIGLCSSIATSSILSSIAVRNLTGNKFVDKFVVPVGVTFIAATVGDVVENKVDRDIRDIKNSVDLMMELHKRMKDVKVDDDAINNDIHVVHHNVFESDEEVTDNGNS